MTFNLGYTDKDLKSLAKNYDGDQNLCSWCKRTLADDELIHFLHFGISGEIFAQLCKEDYEKRSS